MGFSTLFYARRKEFFIHIPTAYCNICDELEGGL
jgi:hypothetical protein